MPKEMGIIVMTALADSAIDSLWFLSLQNNASWWKESNVYEQFLPFLSRQKQLRRLYFIDNSLTSEQTGQLFACLAQKKVESEFEEYQLRRKRCYDDFQLRLDGSCNFSSDESIEQIVLLIDKQTIVKKINLENQQGERQIII